MRRYASIDFLRGTAIVVMLFLHIVDRVLDADALAPHITTLPLIKVLGFVFVPFFGGFAGFFLMVSAMGNMVSMYRHLQAKRSVRGLVVRQVIGGFLLLFFAMLTEAVIGSRGPIGNLVLAIPNLSSWDWTPVLWREYHFETIHTIAWCVVVNGIVQGVLSRRGRWRDAEGMVTRYAVLAVAVLAMTPLAWRVASIVVPGYPYAINPATGKWVMYAYIGKSPWYDFVTLFLLGPIAGHPEPLFPYLAASFAGSVVGVWMSQERGAIPRRFPRWLARIGASTFAVGLAGVATNLAMVSRSNPRRVLELWLLLWDHRYWVPENGVPVAGWLFQFLMLNGAALSAIALVVRLVELRGIGSDFARRTTFVRRYGFVAFSIYAFQFLFYFAHLVVSSIFAAPYARLEWRLVLLTEIVAFAIIQIVLLLWERAKYVGSLEWCLAAIAAKIVPGKQRRLDLRAGFRDVVWLDVVEKEEVDHASQTDSKLAAKLAAFGFLCPPLSMIAWPLSRHAEKTEGANRFSRRAKVLAVAGLVFFGAWLVGASFVTLSDFGVR